jgi:hypothetical protein
MEADGGLARGWGRRVGAGRQRAAVRPIAGLGRCVKAGRQRAAGRQLWQNRAAAPIHCGPARGGLSGESVRWCHVTVNQ